VDRDYLLPCEVLLEGAAGDPQAPGDVSLGEALFEEPAPRLVSDITAPGTPPRQKPATTSV
jgi:hypothetical protein